MNCDQHALSQANLVMVHPTRWSMARGSCWVETNAVKAKKARQTCLALHADEHELTSYGLFLDAPRSPPPRPRPLETSRIRPCILR